MKRIPFHAKYLTYGAATAALYTVLTIAVAPIASGAIQCRVSEALCVLPWFFPAAVPGLLGGCLVANLLLGAPLLDVALGSLATFLAALTTRALRTHNKNHWFAPLPAVLFNGLIMGYVVQVLYSPALSYWVCAAYVTIGQIGACYVLGMPLLFVLQKIGPY